MTEFRAKTASLLSSQKLKLLEEAGLTVVRSDDLDACHAEIDRLKRIIDRVQEYAEGLHSELASWTNAV